MAFKIKFIGKTSSGLGNKYQVLVAASDVQKTKTALTNAGVEFNPNIGELGFISSTHLYLTPKIGDETDVEIKGFKQGSRTVNYFEGIDKDAQKRFVETRKFAEIANAAASFTASLDDAGTTIEAAEAFQRFQNLQLMGKKLQAEITALSKA